MGCVNNITATTWPKQGTWLGRRVVVCFDYDTSVTFPGKIVREDDEDPHQTIIALEDGRFVRSVECQFSLANNPIVEKARLN